MSLRTKAVKGVAWSAVQKWGAQGISFLLFLVLARLLDPDAFGLVALAFIFTEFVQLFLDQGMAQAIIQFPEIDDSHLDTAFWTSFVTAIIMALMGWLLADYVALLFHEPVLSPVVAWLSLNFVIFALTSTQQAILQRKLDFRGLAIRTLIAKLIGGIAGISAAVIGLGVWSLVIQTLTTGLVGVLVLWRVSLWRPSLRLSRQHFRDLFSFGISTVIVRILNYFDLRIDDFLIGYFLGTTALGYYTVAYRILRTMLNVFTSVTVTVAFPTFSKLQHDLDRLRRAYYETTHLISFIVLPSFLGFVLLAPQMMPLLFGEKWEPTVQLAQILTLGGIFIATLQFSGSAAWSLGKPNWVLGVRIVSTGARIIAFLIAIPYGLLGIATAYTVSTVIVFVPLYLWLSVQLMKVDIGIYFKQYLVPAFATLIMLVGLFALNQMLTGLNAYIVVGLNIGVGILLYGVMTRWLEPEMVTKIIRILQTLFPKRRFAQG